MSALATVRRLALWAAPWLALQGCSSLLLPEDPADDATSVATALWTEVDEYYPWFALKGVDWDSVRTAILVDFDADIDERTLFSTLSEMLETLEDGHLSLTSPFGRSSYEGWYRNHPENFDEGVARSYLGPPLGTAARGSVTWGLLAQRIGYLRIASFGPGGVGEGVDAALASLGPVDGLVVDVRNNGGGSDTNSEAAAGRFTDRRLHYRTVRYKNGPGHEEFGPELMGFVEPAGAQRFQGPVVLIQNRRVFSAAEDFVLAMGEITQVTSVGDTTGGGAGNPIGRELPNGWVATVPRWRQFTADGEIFEGIGLAPDELVAAPAAELAGGRDAILERALELLGGS